MSFLVYQKQNPEFLNNYLKYKRFIEFGAETTINEAYFDLRTLLRFLKLYFYEKNKLDTIKVEQFKEIDIKDITLKDLNMVTENILDQYLIFLNNKLNNSSTTRNRKLASTKRFFEYLTSNDLITINPTEQMKTATVKKRLAKYLELKECKMLLSKTINSNNRYKIRNYAITCIFLNCGLRLSELTNINLTDLKIDNSEQTLKVYGKGNKERLIYLNSAVCEAIKKYMEVRPKLQRNNTDYNALFLSSHNKRISKRRIQQIIKDELKEAFENTKDYIHTHSLRHTSTSLLYNENNVNIFVLKRFLGHKCIEATGIYTHVSDKKMKNIMENCTISSLISKGVN